MIEQHFVRRRMALGKRLSLLNQELSKYDVASFEKEANRQKILKISGAVAKSYIDRIKALKGPNRDLDSSARFGLHKELIDRYGAGLIVCNQSLERFVYGLSSPLEKVNEPSDLRAFLLEALDYEHEGAWPLEDELRKLRTTLEHKEAARARFAKANIQSRQAGRSVAASLRKSEICPYCENPLTENVHADHIIPIHLGGLSVNQNMVYVCEKCNLDKGSMTLLEFCETREIDFLKVARRLRALGKRI
ncbi:MAG: HNH endonuclease [Verrucomicrobiales bacterium]|nr:HNH endonuclease [Verrucomicrobiales bacterium]